MKILFYILLFVFVNPSISFALTLKKENINNHSIHVYAQNKPSTTILYIPGCNGLDQFGQQYQQYHISKFKEVWPETNIIISQYVNDYTNGSTNGRCFWEGHDSRLFNKQSFDQAQSTINLAAWIKDQPWSNGKIHVFGFSWGGRVGIWIPGTTHGVAGLFQSVALIWPDCRPVHKVQAGKLHTPTRIWSTVTDPLSVPTNCHTYYETHDKLSLTLYPGSNHSWLDGPFFKPFDLYWPVQKVWVRHQFDKDLAEKTFKEWKLWAEQNEN